jgi:demethylmenaquinone methyltransferase/2-methoxy-6-polyprenyl-1,4-benzoquinol methylase
MPIQSNGRLKSGEMNKKNESETLDILPVTRTKEEAKRSYDRMSKYYDYMMGAFERKYAVLALKLLSIKEGSTVLEIGFGTGYCLKQIADLIGQAGEVHGLDISSGMAEITRRRLEKAGLVDRAKLYCGDAVSLPFDSNTFDAVFMSFTLELFDTPEIPSVLEEAKRVLKPKGKLGVISMSKASGDSLLLKLYEWAHRKWPKYVDCRPIYLRQSIMNATYEVEKIQKVKLLGLTCEIVVAVKER